MGAVLKYWSGSAWVAKPLKYWSGSAWTTKTLKYWNGAVWIGGTTIGFYDSFDRAASALESSAVASGGWSWVHDGLIAAGFQLTGTQLRCNTTDGTGTAYKTPSVGTAEHYVQYKVLTITAATGPFACCRFIDRNNFIGIRTGNGGSNGQIEVYRRIAGALSGLYTSAASAVAINDIIRLECSGTNFTVKKNGVVVTGPTAIGNATLTTPVDTGLLARNTSVMTFDDFAAGAL